MRDDKEDIIEWPEFDKISFCDCVGLNQHAYNRARECVNALAGVENPEQFVGMGKTYIQQDLEIRDLILADENESTYDAVERLFNQRKEIVDYLVKKIEESHEHMKDLRESYDQLLERYVQK